tara:strand:+ start:712 stop:2748 length:2037 start_codon:yes stop_codon:yes gene_type:complete
MKIYSTSIELIVSVFSILLSATASYLVRYNEIEESLLVSIWIICFLVIISLAFRLFLQLAIPTSEESIPNLKLISPILFWLLLIILPVYLLILLTFLGIINFANKNSFHINFKQSLKHIYIPVLYFIVIGSETWNMHRNPLAEYNLIMHAGTGSDVTFFSAITSMLKTYNSCSIGIDGLNSFPYHYGTYFFLSNISEILDLNCIHVNHIIAPIIFLPISLFIMLVLVNYFRKLILSNFNISFSNMRQFDHLIFIAILATLTNAPFGLPFVSNLSFFASPFQIDSQLLANLLFGVMIIVMSHTVSLKPSVYIPSFLFLISIHSVIYVTKSPASHLSLFALFYILIRHFSHRKFVHNILWISTIVICSSITFIMHSSVEQSVVNKAGVLTFNFLSLWKTHLPIREWQWVLLSNGFYTLLSIFIISFMYKNNSTLKVIGEIFKPKLIVVELVVVLTFVTIFLTTIFGGALSFASTYYLDTSKFLSLILCTACLCVVFSRVKFENLNFLVFLKANSPIKVISVLCIVFLLTTGPALSLKGWERTLSKYYNVHSSEISNKVEYTQKVEIFKTFLILSNIQENKSHVCLWIPKSNTIFWNELAEEKNNAFLPFWAVALSEMALIDGYPLNNNLNGHFGYESYLPNSIHVREKKLPEIKAAAKVKGFKKLIVLWDHKNYEIHSIY